MTCSLEAPVVVCVSKLVGCVALNKYVSSNREGREEGERRGRGRGSGREGGRREGEGRERRSGGGEGR